MQKYYAVGYTIDGTDEKTRFLDENIFAIGWEKIGNITKYKSLDDVAEALKNEYPRDNGAKTTFKNFMNLKKGDRICLKKRVLKTGVAETIVYAVGELKEGFPKGYSYEKGFGHKLDIKRKTLDPEWKIEGVAYASTLSVIKQLNIQQEIDNLLGEGSYDLFNKFYKENASLYVKTPEYKEDVEARKQFLADYPLKDFMDIELEDYVVGSGAKDTLCYEFEFGKYTNLGPGIGGGSAGKYGIYYKKEKNSYVNRHGDVISDPEKYWANMKKEIVKLVDDISKANDIDDFDDGIEIFKSMQLPLTKLLNAYCPEKIIGIASFKLLKGIANVFHIHYDNNISGIKLNFLITKTLKERLSCLNHSDHELISHMVWAFPKRVESLSTDNKPLDPKLPPKKLPYGKYEFLDEVFMTEDQYDEVANTLVRKKNIILMGAPGVGKTFCAKKLMYSIMGERASDRIVTVQFHQSYSYEDFIQGYRPTDKGTFKLEEGVFYNLVKDAREEFESALDKGVEPKKYCIIIDEINRGNLSKVFGELMMLIESDKRSKDWAVKLTYSDKDFYIPENLYIIGTMNTADRSLTMIDYALRRRFAFIQLDPAFSNEESANKLKAWMVNHDNVDSDFVDSLIDKYNKLNDTIEKSLGKGFRIGHSYFIGQNLSDNPYEVYNDILNYEIKPLLEEYYYDEDGKVDEVLGIVKNI